MITATRRLQGSANSPFAKRTNRTTQAEKNQNVTHTPSIILNLDTLISELPNLVYIRPEDELTLQASATAILDAYDNGSDNSPDPTLKAPSVSAATETSTDVPPPTQLELVDQRIRSIQQ